MNFDFDVRSMRKSLPKRTSCYSRELEDEFERELNLALGNSGPEQNASCAARNYVGSEGCSSGVKDVGIAVARTWRRKVGMVENIEHFDAELDIEVLGDSSDAIVFEHGEVQAGDSGADQDVAPCVAAKIEALQGNGIAAKTVGVPESRIRCGGNGKTLGLDVVLRMAGIRKGAATWASQAIRKRKIVATQGVRGVAASAPRRGEWHTVAKGENRAQFPAIGNPPSRTSP